VASRDRHSRRNIALVGGAALVAWLLWRRTRGGIGRDGGSGLGVTVPSTTSTQKPPCLVWVRADRIDLDGAPANLATVVARCREAGRADVRATGDAITRSIITVLAALNAAGVVVAAPPDVAHVVALTPEAAR